MYALFAWFSHHPDSRNEKSALAGALASIEPLIPSTFDRHVLGDHSWGVTWWHAPTAGSSWPQFERSGEIDAVSMGMPVGRLGVRGPAALARSVISDGDNLADILPPFGLMGVEGSRHVVVQQDWLGMARLFVGSNDRHLVISNRPSAVAHALGSSDPDLDGWSSYVTAGHFGGLSSPFRGVRLMSPGERLDGRRDGSGTWAFSSTPSNSVERVINRYRASPPALDELVDVAAQALRDVAVSVTELAGDRLALGLSGGKDSRLIAAAFLAGGTRPAFVTNEDTIAEGETARRLIAAFDDLRGERLDHRLVRSGSAPDVTAVGLTTRVARLQSLYDFQFPSSYCVRAAPSDRFPATASPVSVTGAGGELATGYWYPNHLPTVGPVDDEALQREIVSHLLGAVPGPAVAEWVRADQESRCRGLMSEAHGVGLIGLEVLDYIYLVERMRRWSTSAYSPSMVTPFLSPDVVAVMFALTPHQKAERSLHSALLARLAPEWADIPFVSITTGRSTATRVWDGDGLESLCDLFDSAQAGLVPLMSRSFVEGCLLGAVAGGKRQTEKTLQQFAWVAVASSPTPWSLDAPASRLTYPKVQTAMAARDRSLRNARRPWKRVKRSRVGRAIARRVRWR